MNAQPCPRCEEAARKCAAECAKLGLHPSGIRDHGEHWCAEQSRETWPGTYGHPRVWIQVRAPRPSICLSCGHAEAYGGTAGGCPCTAEDKQRAAQALASVAQGRAVL